MHIQALDGCNIQATAKQYRERCKMAWGLYPRRYSLWAKQNLEEEEWVAVQQHAQRWAALGEGQRLDLGVPGPAEVVQQDDHEGPAAGDAEQPAAIIQDVEDDTVQVGTCWNKVLLHGCTERAVTIEQMVPFARFIPEH